MSSPRMTLISNPWAEDLGGEPGWRTCVDQGEGEGMMKAIELHHVRGRSAELGGSEPIATRNPCLMVTMDLWTGRIAPTRGEEGFLGGKPPKGVHQHNWHSSVALITGGHRAITCKAYTSHSCYTFCIEKGNRGSCIRAKIYIYKGEQSLFMMGERPYRSANGYEQQPWCGWEPEPGFQPCCQVLSVTHMKSTPENFVRSNEATGNHVYQIKIHNWDYHSWIQRPTLLPTPLYCSFVMILMTIHAYESMILCLDLSLSQLHFITPSIRNHDDDAYCQPHSVPVAYTFFIVIYF